MARLNDIVVDCRHPASLARFWASVLDDHAVAPYDHEELERLRGMGIDDPEDDPFVLVEPLAGGPRLGFQRVPEPKVVKNRLHFDLLAPDLEREADRLVGLGARVIARHASSRGGRIVLADPEGNELCLEADAEA